MTSIMDKKTVRLKGKFPKYVIAGFVFLLGIWMSDLFPYRSDQYLLLTVPIGAIGTVSAIWQIRSPNSYAKFFLQISGSALIIFLAYRSMIYLFPQSSPYTEVIIVTSFIFTHILPLLNLPIATSIRNELYAPKSWIGKIVFRGLLAIALFGGVSGTLLGKAAAKGSEFAIFFGGVLFFYLAYSIPFIGLSQRFTKDPASISANKLDSKKAQASTRKSSHQLSSVSRKRISRSKKE